MRRAKLAFLAVAALAAAIVGIALSRGARPNMTVLPRASADDPRLRLDWPAGKEFVYAVRWRTDNASRLGEEEQLNVALILDADLQLRSFGDQGGLFVFSASFGEIRDFRLLVQGKAVYADAAAARDDLTGKTAVVEIDHAGAVRRAGADDDPGGVFRHAMRGIFRQMRMTVPEVSAEAWTALEPGPSGTARVRYTLSNGGAILRERQGYESLDVVPPGLAPARSRMYGRNRPYRSAPARFFAWRTENI